MATVPEAVERPPGPFSGPGVFMGPLRIDCGSDKLAVRIYRLMNAIGIGSTDVTRISVNHSRRYARVGFNTKECEDFVVKAFLDPASVMNLFDLRRIVEKPKLFVVKGVSESKNDSEQTGINFSDVSSSHHSRPSEQDRVTPWLLHSVNKIREIPINNECTPISGVKDQTTTLGTKPEDVPSSGSKTILMRTYPPSSCPHGKCPDCANERRAFRFLTPKTVVNYEFSPDADTVLSFRGVTSPQSKVAKQQDHVYGSEHNDGDLKILGKIDPERILARGVAASVITLGYNSSDEVSDKDDISKMSGKDLSTIGVKVFPDSVLSTDKHRPEDDEEDDPTSQTSQDQMSDAIKNADVSQTSSQRPLLNDDSVHEVVVSLSGVSASKNSTEIDNVNAKVQFERELKMRVLKQNLDTAHPLSHRDRSDQENEALFCPTFNISNSKGSPPTARSFNILKRGKNHNEPSTSRVDANTSTATLPALSFCSNTVVFYHINQNIVLKDKRVEYHKNQLLQRPREFRNMIGSRVCAMLNAGGGSIFLGVKPNGKVEGVQCDQKLEDQLRIDIDQMIKMISPHVPTSAYFVHFSQVMGTDGIIIPNSKVIQVEVLHYAQFTESFTFKGVEHRALHYF